MQTSDLYSHIYTPEKYKKKRLLLIKSTKYQASFILDAFKKK